MMEYKQKSKHILRVKERITKIRCKRNCNRHPMPEALEGRGGFECLSHQVSSSERINI